MLLAPPAHSPRAAGTSTAANRANGRNHSCPDSSSNDTARSAAAAASSHAPDANSAHANHTYDHTANHTEPTRNDPCTVPARALRRVGVIGFDGEQAAGPGDQHVLRRRPAAGYDWLSLPAQAEAEQRLGLHPYGVVRPGQLHRPPRPLHHLLGPQPPHRVQRQPLRRQGGHLGSGGVTIGPRAVQQAVRLGSSALQERDVARGDVPQRAVRRRCRDPGGGHAGDRTGVAQQGDRPQQHVARAAPGVR